MMKKMEMTMKTVMIKMMTINRTKVILLREESSSITRKATITMENLTSQLRASICTMVAIEKIAF